MSNLTDDEEFNKEVKQLALGELNLGNHPDNIKDFDVDNSYFSEDENEL